MTSFRFLQLGGIYILLGVFFGFFCLDGFAQSVFAERSSAGMSNSNIEQSKNFEPPYPFTGDELWGKLLNVIMLSPEGVTDSGIEKILGVQFTKIKLSDDEYVGELKNGRNWYFYMNLSQTKTKVSNILFTWKYTVPLQMSRPPTGMCIDANRIKNDLEKNGWRLISSGYVPPPINVFQAEYQRESKHKLVFAFSPDKNLSCMYRMDIIYF